MERIIDVEETNLGGEKVYKVKGCRTLILDSWGFEHLTKPVFKPQIVLIGGIYFNNTDKTTFLVTGMNNGYAYVTFSDGSNGTYPNDEIYEECTLIKTVNVFNMLEKLIGAKDELDEGYQE